MATKYGGYMGKVLKVDLTTQEVCEYPWTDQERELYLGGKIMAAKIMWDNINRRFDPLGEENLLVITTGPITGSGAPSSSRFNISTISPLTGLLVSSNCGGNFGLHLKKAGYDGLVISGRAEKPVWLEVTDQKIQFHPADTLWGQSTSATQNLLGKPGGKIVIGPAGENLVLYAGIFSQERAAGRGGAGAVMGAKKLKAIVADGRQRTVAVNPDKTRELNRQWINYLQKHPVTGRILPELGTANLIRRMQRRNMLATRNFSRGQYEDYESLSGEYLAEYHLIKNSGCPTCPIRCSRVVEVNGREIKGPELETLGLLGPNIENNDLKRICEWNYLLDELGMDTMSTGGTLAFAMELQEKGMWDCGLKFGETDIISEIIRKIAYREEIGDLLADGSRKLADRFGGQDFAMQVKGLELAAYEPRGAVGQGLGYAVANRGGCHLNAGYMAFMEGLGLAMNNHTAQSKAALTIFMQNMMEAVSAAGNCVFTTYAFIPGVLLDDNKSAISFLTNNILKWSSGLVSILNHQQSWLANFHLGLLPHTKALSTLTGMNITFGKFLQIGASGYNLERLFNMRLGLTGDHDKLPLRLTNEYQVPGVKKSRVPLPQLKKDYYRQRGWDKTGFPLKKTIRKLGLPTNTV